MNNRELTIDDVSEVVRIHLLAFADFFLSQMGESFLKLYYKSFLKDKRGFGIGIFDNDGNLIGFSVATTFSNGFNRNLITDNFFAFLIVGMKVLFTKPKSLLRLFMNLSKKTKRIDDGRYAELFSIGVDPKMHGKGLGKLLIANTERIAIIKNCEKIALTTDFFNNDDVIQFYLKCGYHIFYDFTTFPDRKMYKMIKILK